MNACPRGHLSRTRALAEAFLEEWLSRRPDTELTVHHLPEMGLLPLQEDTLAMREALCEKKDWDSSFLRPAVSFARADLVVIAAPYWDLSFPSMLKVWMEHMWVRNLTFVYRNDQPVGLCKASHAVYIASAGSRTDGHDWGRLYVEDCLRTLGIRGFSAFTAQGLDLEGADVGAILGQTESSLRAEAIQLAGSLRIP